MHWGYILGGAAAVGLIGGGVWWYTTRYAPARPQNRAAVSAAAGLSSGPEYAKSSYGPLSEPPAGGGGTWVQDFNTFAGGVSNLAGAIDRFV